MGFMQQVSSIVCGFVCGKISHKKLAKRTGIPIREIKNILYCNKNMKFMSAIKIVEYFGYSMEVRIVDA